MSLSVYRVRARDIHAFLPRYSGSASKSAFIPFIHTKATYTPYYATDRRHACKAIVHAVHSHSLGTKRALVGFAKRPPWSLLIGNQAGFDDRRDL
jgi:hypothetical protein